MGEANTRKVIYEALRQSRGGAPEAEVRTWRRKVYIGGAGVFAVILGVVGYFVWDAFTFVYTTRASVCAAVLSLSPDTDARVRELLVQPGDAVSRGQVLLRLDDSEARASQAATEAARTIAEARVVSAQADLDMRAARQPDEVRRAEAERREAEARLAQLKRGATAEEIEAAKIRLASARALAELYAGDVKESEKLVAAGYESRHDLEVQKTRLLTQQNAAREAELELARLQAGPTADQVQAAEQLLAARDAAWALARSGARQIESMKADLAARRAELARAEADVIRGRATLERMTVVSPVAGTVLRTFIHEGEVCRRGVVVAFVSDDAAGRWFEGYVREKDAHALRTGQRARVETVVGSGDYVDATVEAVGLATSSLSQPAAEAANARALGAAEMVWVKLRPVDLKEKPLPGMSANATIRVR